MRVFVTGGSGFVGGHLLDELADRGHETRALARSHRSARVVEDRGAAPVRGDLHAPDALREGMAGCDLVVHAAAVVEEDGDDDLFERVNVGGTRHVVEAARDAGVDRLVHVSTEAVLLEPGRSLVDVDETLPRTRDPVGAYCATKARAEEVVEEAVAGGLDAVIVRPRFVWGPGDTTLLPGFVEAVEEGDFRWIDGGRYRVSTTHVRNAVHGILRAAEAGEAGEVYFVTDGEPVEFRRFLTRWLATAGVTPPDRSLPRWVARALARTLDVAWRWLPLPGRPVLNPATVQLVGEEVTLDIGKARRELGYEPVVSVEEGLRELEAASDPVPSSP